MLISLTVGKVDAGVAVLLTEDKRLIEFPSILLPPSITSGSIVDITVARNTSSETLSQKTFSTLQSSIFTTYGLSSPSAPIIRLRNATQTSVVLEWDKIELATADLRSLSLYRNGAKAGVIPQDKGILATKVSGLAVDTEYTFHLVLRTSAGQYTSEKLAVKTHKMTDLSGITVTPGVLPSSLRESLSGAVERIDAKLAETVRIDTTHFVCTEGRGREWEKAVEMNIPVVRPEWIEGCEREGRIVGVRGYYLNADPRLRQVGQGLGMQQQGQRPMQQRGESQRTIPMREQQQQQQSPTPATPATAKDSPSTTLGVPSPEREPRESVGGPPPPLPEKDSPHKGEGPGTEGEETKEESQDVSAVTNPGEEPKEQGLGVSGLQSGGEEEEEEEEKEPKTPAESIGNFSEVQL